MKSPKILVLSVVCGALLGYQPINAITEEKLFGYVSVGTGLFGLWCVGQGIYGFYKDGVPVSESNYPNVGKNRDSYGHTWNPFNWNDNTELVFLLGLGSFVLSGGMAYFWNKQRRKNKKDGGTTLVKETQKKQHETSDALKAHMQRSAN